MKTRSFLFPGVFVLAVICSSCGNDHSDVIVNEDGSITFFVPEDKIVYINQTDSNGNRQGRWEETDTVNHRTLRKYYYRDNVLDGEFLEYKSARPDTLVFGNYVSGKKNGKWKYWHDTLNSIDRVENYSNGELIETIEY